MQKFFDSILKFRVFVLIGFVFVLAWAFYGLSDLNVSSVPDVTNKQVMINTKTGSYSTEQIEKIVSYPIETEMLSLPYVEEVRSLSKYGLSQVIVVFEDAVDIYFARQLVSIKLQTVSSELPDGLSPELGPVSSGLGEIFMWTLDLKEGSERSLLPRTEQLRYLRRVQDYTIRPKLKKIQGIAEVDTNGGFVTQIHINYFPQKLSRYGMNINEVLTNIEDMGVSYGGSYIKDKGEQVIVRSVYGTPSLKEIENFVLKIMPSGRSVKVNDIATVKFENLPRVGGATYMGKETVLGTVLMRIGSNSRKVSMKVQEELESLNLPDDVELKVVYDRKFLVDKTIQTVAKNLVEGALLVIFVLLMILGNFRASLIVALAIPFSMGIAFKGMQIFGISANLMSLGAIDFGLLVDASVVFVENYIRRLHEHKGGLTFAQRFELLVDSSREVAKPVIFGLAIIMLVYIPILSLEGVEGKMFHPMALTVLMALAVSLFVALFITPILMLYFVKKDKDEEHDPLLFRLIQKSYLPALNFVLRFRVSSVLLSLFVFLLSMLTFSTLGTDFVPQLDEGDMIIGLVRDSRQNIDKSIEEQKKAEKIIKQFGEVDYVFSRIGTPESATDPMSPNFADTFVMLKKDQNDWPMINGRRRSKDELFKAIEEKLKDGMDEQAISATQPIEMRFNEVLEGSRADVTLRFIGPELQELMRLAQESEKLLQQVGGIQSLEFDALTGLTTSRVLDISLNTDEISQMGLSLYTINRQVQTALAGKEVGYFFVDGIKQPVIFHLDESLRNDMETIENLPISLETGGFIPLKSLANFTMDEKVTTIARRWAERYSAISIYVGDRDIESLVGEAKSKIEKNLEIKPGYSVEWGGQFKNLARAKQKLAIILPLTLLGIFFLIWSMTQSVVQSIIIFSAVPLGLAGGVFTLALRGMNFSVSAAIGFIALSGIVILNSLVLVNFIQDQKNKLGDAEKAIREGALSRLRPVCMTALVASLGFIPMAFNTGMGAEVQRPLATVVIGGLFTSTILTMLVVPVLLSLSEKLVKKEESQSKI